jgi:hypothetical protein
VDTAGPRCIPPRVPAADLALQNALCTFEIKGSNGLKNWAQQKPSEDRSPVANLIFRLLYYLYILVRQSNEKSGVLLRAHLNSPSLNLRHFLLRSERPEVLMLRLHEFVPTDLPTSHQRLLPTSPRGPLPGSLPS